MTKKKLDLRRTAHDEYLRRISPGCEERPNLILILADDMGYGDISCFGSQAISTPCLDALARDGVRLENFYAASPVCSPSRFSCLTGRYPTRGFFHNVLFPSTTASGRLRNVSLFPSGVSGILPDEITLPEALRAGGYRTAMFGKWHLGDKSPNLPNEKGFDYFYGALYSVDMEPYRMYRNREVAQDAPIDKRRLTPMLTADMLDYLERYRDDSSPFFLYYASPYPHHPAAASERFAGKSRGGTYGDCVEELDWSVGQLQKKLRDLGKEKNTFLIFTSDNGPWFEGNPGNHRGRKGSNFDGGHMVPFLAAWPGHIPAGSSVPNPAMNIDFFPTFLHAAGIPLPGDRVIDGVDILPLLTGKTDENLHEAFRFITGDRVLAIRTADDKKYMVQVGCDYRPYTGMKMGPFLFDMTADPQESYNVSNLLPDTAAELQAKIDADNAEIQKNPRGWLKSGKEEGS